MAIRDNMAATIEEAFKANSAMDYDRIRQTHTDDFVHQILPASLQAATHSNDGYKHLFDNVLKPGLAKLEIQAVSSTYDVDQKKASVYGTLECDGLAGPKKTDFVMMFSFNEDGTKIARIDEYLDTDFYKTYFPQVGAALAAKAGK
ncbi:hypothetical protein PRZ48_008335 [Zasmidium cellare]|uniref:SnoaL-like domain-containing protein n=1 Tax=Zasmidium cellare TaxID=395010 RepID=A0ABR0EF61_ZASCE|nr:hypothetical protein PRZ48_008335 [Zasmidium cellare]